MTNPVELFWDTGVRLRCPVCEQGRLFTGWFQMNATCPHCHVRFERHEGEVVGGMGISIVVTSLIFLIGYLGSEWLFEWPLWLHLSLWLPFALLFPIAFYRHSRALWVAILHLSGEVYWDREPYTPPTLSITDAFLNRAPPPDESDEWPPPPLTPP